MKWWGRKCRVEDDRARRMGKSSAGRDALERRSMWERREGRAKKDGAGKKRGC